MFSSLSAIWSYVSRLYSPLLYYLELVFLPVDDDGCDLLIEEDENRRQQSRNERSKRDPPGREVDRIDQPTAVIARRL